MRLTGVVKEIAEVIGRERALYLIGRLPRCYCKSNGSAAREYVVMYVPKAITTQHNLVKILGWIDANKLVRAFGGEIMHPGMCAEIYRTFRDESIVRLHRQGMTKNEIAALMDVSERHVRNLLMLEKPQKDLVAANDNNVRTLTKPHRKNGPAKQHSRMAG